MPGHGGRGIGSANVFHPFGHEVDGPSLSAERVASPESPTTSSGRVPSLDVPSGVSLITVASRSLSLGVVPPEHELQSVGKVPSPPSLSASHHSKVTAFSQIAPQIARDRIEERLGLSRVRSRPGARPGSHRVTPPRRAARRAPSSSKSKTSVCPEVRRYLASSEKRRDQTHARARAPFKSSPQASLSSFGDAPRCPPREGSPTRQADVSDSTSIHRSTSERLMRSMFSLLIQIICRSLRRGQFACRRTSSTNYGDCASSSYPCFHEAGRPLSRTSRRPASSSSASSSGSPSPALPSASKYRTGSLLERQRARSGGTRLETGEVSSRTMTLLAVTLPGLADHHRSSRRRRPDHHVASLAPIPCGRCSGRLRIRQCGLEWLLDATSRNG
jgi:hypothetical protein